VLPSPTIIARTISLAALLFAAPAFAQVAVKDLPKPSREIEEPFSLITGAIEIKPNQVLAVDATEGTLALVDFAKGTRSPVGRQGSGPGEYRAPAGLLRVRGDTIWLIDAMLQRITAFNPDLSPGTTFPMLMLDQATMTVLTAPFFSDRSGRVYSSAMKISAGVGGGGGNDMQMTLPDSVGLVKFDPRQAARTEVTKLRFPISGKPEISRSGNSMKYTMAFPGFVAADPWAVFPDGRIAIIRGATYTVEFIAPDGTRSTAGRIAYQPVKLTEADQKAEMAEARRAMQEQGKVAQKMLPAGFSMDFELLPPASWPANYPPVAPLNALAAPDGRLWVKRNMPFRLGREQWDVIDATGKLVASWRLPAKTTIAAVGQGVAYTVRTDEDDLRYIQRVEIPR
jgi:hypothetical protein